MINQNLSIINTRQRCCLLWNLLNTDSRAELYLFFNDDIKKKIRMNSAKLQLDINLYICCALFSDRRRLSFDNEDEFFKAVDTFRAPIQSVLDDLEDSVHQNINLTSAITQNKTIRQLYSSYLSMLLKIKAIENDFKSERCWKDVNDDDSLKWTNEDGERKHKIKSEILIFLSAVSLVISVIIKISHHSHWQTWKPENEKRPDVETDMDHNIKEKEFDHWKLLSR